MGSSLRDGNIRDWSDDLGNRIIGAPKLLGPTKVEFVGENNVVIFGSGSSLQGSVSFRRGNSTVHFGERAMFRGRMSLGEGCAVRLGNDIYWGPNGYVTTAEGANVLFGDDLLISENCTFRADDSHPIYDAGTGTRINPSRDVVIENHVWIGVDALVMPGARIGEGAILGARSMVTASRPVPARALAVGSPAIAIRENVHWVRKHLQNSTDIDEQIEPIFVDRLTS